MNMALPKSWSSGAFVIVTVLLSFIIATYSPMTSFVHAQTAADSERVKQRVIKELDRRIAVQQKALDATKKGYDLIDKNYERSNEARQRMNERFGITTDPMIKIREDNKKMQESITTSMQKTIDGLRNVRNQVSATTSYASLQALAKNVDAQYGLNRLVQVQGAVVLAIDNAKAAVETLQLSIKNQRTALEKQLACYKPAGGQDSASCGDYVSDVPTSEEINQRLNKSLDQAESQAKSFAQVIDSSLALFKALTDGFANIVQAKLGVQSGNLDQLGRTDLTKLKSASESVDGLFSSLRGIVTQLNVANTFLKNASANLKVASADQ